MKLRCFTVGRFAVNTYLVEDPATGQCAIVDTGEGPELRDRLAALDPAPQIAAIWLTHGHLDHAGALGLLQERWPVPTWAPRLEKGLLDTVHQQPMWFGLPPLVGPPGSVDHWIDDGAELRLGESRVRFISTPGHTPGQGCFYDESDIIVGDTIFKGSVGRTDFPLSDPALAKESLRRLMELDPALKVHSGHGPVTTLGHEKKTNPFLAFLRGGTR